MVQEVVVEGNITLGQFLKTEGIIESGRGKKLEHNDRIDITDIPEDTGSFLIIHQGEQ